MRSRRLLYICDWLPPDFGAVGQYSLQFARDRAAAGEQVVLAGLSTAGYSVAQDEETPGDLKVVRFFAPPYAKGNMRHRIRWTLRSNIKLLWGLRRELAWADEILFTGSPPFMLHLIAPLNLLLLRRKLVYRITDFHPECFLAAVEKPSLALKLFHELTVFWRRKVQQFEVLGEDQRERLRQQRIPLRRVVLKRDQSPVVVGPSTRPLERPPQFAGKAVLLYSGNFGVAHDHETFLAGYERHHRQGSGRTMLWLNAVGNKADVLDRELKKRGLPVHRSSPVPLEDLPRLLVTPDSHLITLRDSFVGYVLPSKVYGCVDSGRDVLYIGSKKSDVHLLAAQKLPGPAYQQLEVGDADGVFDALERIADRANPAPAARQRRQSHQTPALAGSR